MALVRAQAVSHLVIQVSDVARSTAFYENVFGYRVMMDNRNAPDDPRTLGVVAGMALEILKAKSKAAAPAGSDITAGGPGYTLVSFSVADIESTLEALRSEDLAGPEPATEIAGMKYAFIRDPDGILLELIQLPQGAKALADIAHTFKGK